MVRLGSCQGCPAHFLLQPDVFLRSGDNQLTPVAARGGVIRPVIVRNGTTGNGHRGERRGTGRIALHCAQLQRAKLRRWLAESGQQALAAPSASKTMPLKPSPSCEARYNASAAMSGSERTQSSGTTPPPRMARGATALIRTA